VSVTVQAAAEECYRQWLQFDRFPKFMRRIVSVTRLMADVHARDGSDMVQDTPDALWRCEVRGPFGRTYGLNIKLLYQEPDKCISWATSEEGGNSDIESTGTVNFLKPAGEQEGGPTLVNVTMSYSPNGLFGDLITDMTAYGDNVVDDCLQ